VFIAALGVGALVFSPEHRRTTFIGLLKAGALAAVVYLPWFIWAWRYYGHPVPNTVIAKSYLIPTDLLDPGFTLGLIWNILRNYPIIASRVFEPIYASLGGWPEPWLTLYGLLGAFVGTIYWLIPSTDRLGRLASLLFTLIALYLTFVDNWAIAAAPWYLPSAGLFGMLVLARAGGEIARRLPLVRHHPLIAARIGQAIFVACSIALLAGTFVQMRIQQLVIEDNHRQKIGLWLRQVVKPGETVYLEPLGYIGYFSQAHMLDWPGLVAPQVVSLRRATHVDMPGAALLLHPDWIILRPPEFAGFDQHPEAKKEYYLVKVYNASNQIGQYGYIPGRNLLDVDAVYYVFHKIPPSSPLVKSPAPLRSPAIVKSPPSSAQ
jgi:hypothetical protein